MGVRPLDLDSWLLVDDDLEADRADKATLLADRYHDVVAVTDGSEAPAAEVHEAIVGHLRAAGHPVPPDPGSRHPIEAAARLVQEDLVVLEHDGTEWCLTAACVCFPTRWDLASKRGRSMAAIHEPVPRYDTDLGRQTDRFFDRLHVDKPVWRSNWTIDADWSHRLEPSTRADPASIDAGPLGATEVAERLCLRLEYQTLRRMPLHDSILFTIRILRRPLQSVLLDGSAQGLADALVSMPDDVAVYKSGSVAYRPQILEWLASNGFSPS